MSCSSGASEIPKDACEGQRTVELSSEEHVDTAARLVSYQGSLDDVAGVNSGGIAVLL